MTDRPAMNKRNKTYPRPLADFVGRCLGDVFARQGFASGELVTHWPEIAGAEIAAHAEPLKLQWPRGGNPDASEPATLVLRVEGPAAVEIQHLAPVILERVNRFLGWRAVARIVLRQAPLARRTVRRAPSLPDAEAAARIAEGLGDIGDADLRAALARLGAAVKQS
jgi:hypothetical protein